MTRPGRCKTSVTVATLVMVAAQASAVDIVSIRPNAWSATQPPERKFNDCNSLIVEADEFVIVVDAQENAEDVQQIIDFAKEELGKPVQYLVNTHWHSDHTQGNTLYRETFGEDLVIIGHATHEEDIFGRAAPYVRDRVAQIKAALPAAREQLVTGIKRDGSAFSAEELAAQTKRVEDAAAWVEANEDVRFTGPSKMIDSAYSIEAGLASFSVHPMRGHTRGDLVISFGELGVVATGDLVDAIPYAGHGYPREWLAALKDIRLLGARTYLPGHGPLLEDDLLLKKLLTYFDTLTTQVAELHEAGNTADAIKAGIDLSMSREMLVGNDETAGRFFDGVQGEAIDRAIAELD